MGYMNDMKRGRFFWLLVVAVLLVAPWAVWSFTPLNVVLSAEGLMQAAHRLHLSPFAPLIVIGLYILGSLVLFPVNGLVLLTALAFDPLEAVFVGILGVVLSAMTGFCLGRAVGEKRVARFSGAAFHTISRLISENAVLSVAVARHIPVAPFTVTNMIIGCTDVTAAQFIAGNVLGVGPSVVAWSIIGREARSLLLEPSAGSLALVAALSAAGLLCAFAFQRYLRSRVV